MKIQIGEVIQKKCWDQRLSLKDLSRHSGVPYSTLHTWQLNRQPKDILKALKLAHYFKISLHELLFGVSDQYESAQKTARIELQGDEVLTGRFEVAIRRLDEE